MKKQLLFMLLLLPFMSFAQTWNGTVSHDWTDPLNWNPNAVPNNASIITILPSANYPMLQGNVSVGGISGGNGSTIDFNGFSLTMTGVNGYNNITGTTLMNSNATTDIVLNLNLTNNGYDFKFNGNTVNDNITINLSGNDTYFEGNSGLNTFNGNVTYNVNGSQIMRLCDGTMTQYNGNLTFNRLTAGSSLLFISSGYVVGNFSYQNSVGGAVSLGNASTMTNILGTCNISAIYPSPNSFSLVRIKNQTNGGSVNVQNSNAPTIQNDSVKVNTLSIQGYKGNGYTTIYNNKIEGVSQIADDVTYGGGYNTEVRNNTFNGPTTFTINGTNTFYDANGGVGSANTYNGNTWINCQSTAQAYISQTDKSIFNGNLTILRTGAANTKAFNAGASIVGNFSYTNLTSGESDFGNLSNATTIGGTINMNVNSSPIAGFYLYRVTNSTAGGKINVQNSRGFYISNDTLKVDSLNVISYRGNEYARFYNNQLDGQLQLADSVSYTGGYNTTLYNNTINGNAQIKMYSSNNLEEANSVGNPNTFNGDVTFFIAGTGSLYTNQQAKSTVTGNYTVNRTGAGYTRLFATGATIGGNFSYTKNSSGGSDIGILSSKSSIAGTVNINVTQTNVDVFSMHRLQNLVNGGIILVQNTKAPNIQQDSLLCNSISFVGYGGGAYCYVYDNQLNGVFTMQDIASYSGGYSTNLQNNTFIGNSTFTILGSNEFNEANATNRQNIFNGDLTINCNGTGSLYTSRDAKSTITGNLIVSRTVAGYTRLFANGATIGGNFTYTKNNAGASDLGNIAAKTSIAGTINMNVTQALGNGFSMHRIQNLTNGGSISIFNTSAPSVQQDSLLVSSLSFIGYGTGEYAYFLNNQITGNVTITDSANYAGGYNTSLQNNTINGNSVFTILGTNDFNESNSAQPNVFNGNVTYNCNGSGSLYTSKDSKTIIAGDLTVNRTVAGYTRLFANGATIGGNFSYTKNNAGASDLGTTATKTSIQGTISMNVTQNLGNAFTMYWLKNLTNGGSISIGSTNAPNIQMDSLMLTSFNYNAYGNGGYASLLNNHIQGNFAWADAATYGGGYNTTFSNNTITGNSTITVNGSNTFHDGGSANSGNTYLGDVTYIRNAGIMNIGNGDTNSYAGNFVLNNSAASPINTELIKFIGSANTSIDQLGTGKINIQKLMLNKTSSAKVTLNKPVIVSSSCTFNNGYIQSNTTNPLIFPDNINHNNASDNSHVIGCVSKAGNDIFTFPLGNGIGYHPVSITAPATTTDTFQACIILKHPSDDGYNITSKDPALLQIAPYHYWTLNQTAATTAETVSLGWSIPCANTVITSLPNMAVSRWNGSQWDNLGNGGTIGTTSLGSVSSAATTANYGVFALATTSASNAWQVTSVSASSSTICAGTSTTLTASGANTYTWMPGNLTGTSVIVSPIATTTYTVIGTSATGCITTATKLITVNSLPNVTASASLSTVCSGSPTTITANGAVTYSWQPGSLTGATINVNPLITTTYTVTGTNSNGCTNTDTKIILVNPLPNVNASASSTSICLGSSTSITGSGAVSYTWQPGSLAGNVITVSPNTPTTYTITGTDANSCLNTNTISIAILSLPAITSSATPSTVCAGNPVSLSANGGVSYSWLPGSLTGSTVVVSPLTTTTYTVTGTSANGCTSISTTSVSVNPIPNIATTALPYSAVCTGGIVKLTATGGASYAWTGGISNGVNFNPTSTTVYTVTVTGSNGCTNTSSRTIYVGTCATCNSNIVVSTSPYSILLTESTTFIQTSGTVKIDSGKYVKFDAAPTSYVKLEPGFSTTTGAIFIAQAFNGCTAGSPQIPSEQATTTNTLHEDESIFVYPNPTTGKVTIVHPATLQELDVFDLSGKRMLHINTSGGTQTDIDVGPFANGIYLLYAQGYTRIKIIKN